ncbi:MAG: M1 family aminopeptidase, partial [bacterium]
CYDYPNDKMTSEMIATVNNQFMVISNGKLLEVQDNQNATKTYHWKESAPHSSYLISLVAGEFEKLTDSFQNISVEYYVRKQFVDWAPRSFSKTPDMMQFFSEITEVTYPYEKYAQTAIQDFTFGGMENISATTLTENTLHDEIAASDVTSDGLVAHELAHQWWGDLVTCENWSHAWLNESFATYFDALYVEHSKGKSEFQWEMLGNRKSFLEEDFEKYRRPIVTFFYTDPVNLFDGHLYPKGAWVLHMLRFELGDKIFFQGLHHYLKQHAYQPVETDDLRQALEDASGKNLDRFFEQWLYHGGYPEFDLSWSWDPNTQEVTLSVQQAQALDALTPIFSVPVEVKLVTETGSKSCRIRSDSLQQRFKFESLQNPKMVLFDPEGWILKLKRFHKSEGEWLYQLGHAVNVVSRIEAAATLGIKPASVASIAALKEALQNDSFYGVRIEAAHSLGEFRTAEALQALKTGLNDAKSVVRREVVKALGKFEGQVQAAEWVFLSFKTDKSYFVRADALTALGKLKSPQAPDVLMQALKIDSYREVIRSGALKGFAEFGDASNAAILMNWAKYGQPKDARNVAIEALGKLGKAHRSDKIGQFLLQLLADPDFRARRAAVSALGEMKYTDALNELWKSARQEWDGRLRQQAREAIKKILGFKKK